jgi:hypothetical protein
MEIVVEIAYFVYVIGLSFDKVCLTLQFLQNLRLEQFAFGCSMVTARCETVQTVLRGDGLQGLGDGVPQGFRRSRLRLSQEGLDLSPNLLDRVAVRRVRRQVSHPVTRFLQQSRHRPAAVGCRLSSTTMSPGRSAGISTRFT